MLILLDVACVAFFVAFILTPAIRDAALQRGLTDTPDGERKTHNQPIPRLGGVAVMVAYLTGGAFLLLAPYRGLTFDIPSALDGGLRLAPAMLLIFATGLCDDLIGLKPWQKLTGQIAAALVAYFAGFGVHVIHGHPLADWTSAAVSVIWLVGCTNAFNLIDGLDGLAAGVGTFAALTTLVAALVHGHIELAVLTAPLVGSLLGFLRYNFNPASIFLGDSGSLSIGFLLGCYAAAWGQKSATLLGMTAPLMALALPLLDTGLSIVRRFLRNQPIFGADRGHIHHRLLDQGLTARRVALILYAVCGTGAVLSLLQDFTGREFSGLIIIMFSVVTWIGIQHLGYSEFAVAGRLVFRGTLRSTIDAHIRLAAFKHAVQRVSTPEELHSLVITVVRDFGFSSVILQLPGFSPAPVRFIDTLGGAEWELRFHTDSGATLRLTCICNPNATVNVSMLAVTVHQAVEAWMSANLPEHRVTAAAVT